MGQNTKRKPVISKALQILWLQNNKPVVEQWVLSYFVFKFTNIQKIVTGSP